MLDEALITALKMASELCITHRETPFSLASCGNCFLRVAGALGFTREPREILVVPYTAAGYAMTDGGISLFLNRVEDEQHPVALPPVMAVILL